MGEKLLVHSCCGPCTVYPLEVLRNEGWDIYGIFHNPNIHPYKEFKERYKSYDLFCEMNHVKHEIDRNYGLNEYLDRLYGENIDKNMPHRCKMCYTMRLEYAAKRALELDIHYFTTTLLVSPFQQHDLIREIGERIALENGLKFVYRDFREGFRPAQDKAREMGLYMQGYCGCIFSEYDRYRKRKKPKPENAEIINDNH